MFVHFYSCTYDLTSRYVNTGPHMKQLQRFVNKYAHISHKIAKHRFVHTII